MNVIINKFKADKLVFYNLILGIIFLLLSLVSIAVFFSRIPPIIPLFNQMPWGEARLGEKIYIFIPPVIALIIYIINCVISYFIYESIPLLARILCITSMLVTLFTLLFCIRTIQLIL